MLATMWAPLPPGVPSEALPPPAPSSVTVALETSAGTVMLPVPAAEQVIVVVAPETTGAPHTPSALAGPASAARPARARALVAASAVSRLGRQDVRGCTGWSKTSRIVPSVVRAAAAGPKGPLGPAATRPYTTRHRTTTPSRARTHSAPPRHDPHRSSRRHRSPLTTRNTRCRRSSSHQRAHRKAEPVQLVIFHQKQANRYLEAPLDPPHSDKWSQISVLAQILGSCHVGEPTCSSVRCGRCFSRVRNGRGGGTRQIGRRCLPGLRSLLETRARLLSAQVEGPSSR